jgi:hypothetical protein
MAEAGLEPVSTDRPGIYGYRHDVGIHQIDRTTIDLIVPEAYAGAGRRAARITGQKNAATKARGIELALYDRSLMTLRPLPGDPDQESIEVMVAGSSALLVAKAYKVRDRIRDYDSRPHRLRAKDSVDIGLLMLASDPTKVAATMHQICLEHPELAGMDAVAAEVIVSEYLHDQSKLVRHQMLDGIARRIGPSATDAIDTWLHSFRAERDRLTGESYIERGRQRQTLDTRPVNEILGYDENGLPS